MSIFKFNRNKKAAERPSVLKNFSPVSAPLISNDTSSFAVMDKIASEVALLSYGIYKGTGASRQKLDRHYLIDVLKQPSLDEGHYNFFYQTVIDYFNGGAFWYKVKDTGGTVVSLFRLNPASTRVSRDPVTNRRTFLTNGNTYTSDEVVYIPGRWNYSTLSGGSSIFNAAKGTFETSRNLKRFTDGSFTNGINGQRLVVDITNALPEGATEKQVEELKANFEASYGGVENSGKSLFKKKGFDFSTIGTAMDNKGAALIENREFQASEVKDVFGFPEKFDNLENFFVWLDEFGIRPIATQIEEAINSLKVRGDDAYFEFNYNSLLKVSLTQRIDAYTKQLGSGQLSINEIRAKENLPPVEEGDTIFVPVNYMPWNRETKEAYMAKQKLAIQQMQSDPTDTETQHIPQGDDKQ